MFLVNFTLFAQSISPPVFSVKSGFYPTNFDLVLNHPDTNLQIIYTTDGSEPMLNNLIAKPYQYKKQYYNNIPITLSAISLPGNVFLFWEKDGEIYSRLKELVVSPHENFGIKAVFEKDIANVWDIDTIDILIYPNSTINTLNILATKNVDLEYKLYTLSGQLINKGIITHNKLDVSYLPSATYLLELTQNGNKFVKK